MTKKCRVEKINIPIHLQSEQILIGTKRYKSLSLI